MGGVVSWGVALRSAAVSSPRAVNCWATSGRRIHESRADPVHVELLGARGAAPDRPRGAAAIFDFADGGVARGRHRSARTSIRGPTFFFQDGADRDRIGPWACGIGRFVPFNAPADALAGETGKVKYFDGTPIPTNILIVRMRAVLQLEVRLRRDGWLGLCHIGGLVLHPLTLI